jgi:hypothetical protein
MVVTTQYEVPQLNFGRVMREKILQKQGSKTTMIDAKKINLQLKFTNVSNSSEDKIKSSGQRSHDFAPKQKMTDLLTN